MALNNSSISFNGVDQYAELGVNGSIRGLGSFAYGFYFKVGDNSTRPDQHAYVERQGTGNLIRFRFTPIAGKLQFGFSPKDGVADTSYTYNTKWDDRWHHAVFTARLGERSTYEILLDAVVVASGTLVVPEGVTKVDDTAPLGIYMGASSNNGTTFRNFWHGLVDDVIINSQSIPQGTANEYLSSLKRWDEQHDPNPPKNESMDDNIIVYYPFDENTGTTSLDRGSTKVPEPTQNQTWYHGPQQTATFFKGSSPSNTLWAKDRPYLGDGIRDTTPPTTPGSPTTSNITNDGFRATWTASDDNVWVQFYDLQVSEFANFATYTAFDMGRVLTKNVTGLLPATNYYWRVRAFDAELNPSGYSATRSLTTLTTGDVNPPNPPTNLSASFVTHSSFRLSFNHSVSVDAVGYKVDISPDPDFKTFLSAFRNQDVGNGTFVDVFGVKPLSSYYVRMRAYDAFDNESNDSTILRVNTPRQPDITPPLPVVVHEPEPVSATTATLRWAEGVDDTAVVGYYVDISHTATFADRVLTATQYWDDVDVGNVTKYRVEGLEPATTYYYRVRAYDEAGNVGGNSAEGVLFETMAHSLFEGGPLQSDEIRLTWRENTTLEEPTPRVGDSTSLFLNFDLRDVVGTLQSTTLRFVPRTFLVPTVFGSVGIRAAVGDINAVPSGREIEVSITQVDEYIEVDISPLMPTPDRYTIQIRSLPVGGYTGYIDAGIEVNDFNENNPLPPSIRVVTDPMSSSQPVDPMITVSRHYRENLAINPTFENDLFGWVAEGTGATITRVAGGTDGGWQLQYNGGQNTGFTQQTTYASVDAGVPVTASMNLSAISGGTSYRIYLTAYNTDGGFISNFVNADYTIPVGSTRRISVGGITPANTALIQVHVWNTSATTSTARADNVLIEEAEQHGAAFTGNTSLSEWVGEAHRSISRTAAPTISVISPYIGDNNENNSLKVFFRHENDKDVWISHRGQVRTNRALKQHEFDIGPSITAYNMIKNPSFELASTFWSGGERLESAAHLGAFGYRVADSPYTAVYSEKIFVSNEEHTVQAQVLPDEGKNAYIYVRFFSSTNALLGNSSSAYAYGVGTEWERIFTTFTPPANAQYMLIEVRGDGPFVIDEVQANKGPLLPYRDGTILDGVWEGNPHLSMTGMQLLPETAYDIRFEYTDPEGFFDADDSRTYVFTERFDTPVPHDDVFNAEPFDLSATENTINVRFPYSGDDNNNALVRMEFRRSDLTVWSELRPIYDRSRKEILATIPNVKHGTNYTVRASITDPDGVNGAQNNMVVGNVTTAFLTTGVDTDPHISFGGFVLMGRDDSKIGVTSHNAFGFPERRVTIETLPRLDGGVEMQALWGTKTIDMEGFVSGDSRADLDQVVSALKLGLAANKQRLVIDTLSRRGRFYYATVESLDIPEDAEENIRHLRWRAQFSCADPFAYDIAETSVPRFTASNNDTISVVNSGDTQVSPYLSITTACPYPVNVAVINTSTGERIAPKSTIISGNRLIIDTERRSLTKNGVEIDYSGSFPTLAVGGNEFKFVLSVSRTATTAEALVAALLAAMTPLTIDVDMRWRHRYL